VAKVYVMNEDGSTQSMTGIRCVNEDLELQRILEMNPDLVPGDQIKPSDPRRWLVVRREMPVPDPGTGENRWSIDLFFVDQDAMPTFIECKRYSDTDSRRKVVGQMLEYAANGHHYWSTEDMRNYAEQAAEKIGMSLEEELKRLKPDGSDTVDEFFQQVEDNLREGQIRLIFFMEEAPAELKSVVEFLNKQMERSQVLIVEARQYEHQGMRIVNPVLFGFTEEARQVKKTVSITTGERRKWDKESFFADARVRLQDAEVKSMKLVLDKLIELKSEISWGNGKASGSYSAKWAHFGKNTVLSVYSDGRLTVNFGNFGADSDQHDFLALLKDKLVDDLGLPVPDDYERRYPNYQVEEWTGKTEEFLNMLEVILEATPVSNDIQAGGIASVAV
jgi:hypothetical protein